MKVVRVFHLLLTGTNGNYTATPTTARGRGRSVNFSLPPELAIAHIAVALSRELAAPAASASEHPITTPEDCGKQLAKAVLIEDVAFKLKQERDEARAGMLLIRLDIQSPELAALPWEFLWDATNIPPGFLGTARGVTIVRDTPGTIVQSMPTVVRPLRVRVMVASPLGLPALALTREVDLLEAALAEEIKNARVVFDRIPGQTAEALYEALKPQNGPVHVFHFAGHGDFDEGSGEGRIILCDAQGGPQSLDASDLESALGQSEVRFIVLNCCQSATNSKADLFSAVASRVLPSA